MRQLRIAVGCISLFFSGALAWGQATPADPRIEQILSQLERVRWPQLTAVSPDGRWMAWTVDEDDIEVAPLAKPAANRRITVCREGQKGSEYGVAWAPDSHQLAFLSSCGANRQLGIYVVSPDAAAVPRLLVPLNGGSDSLAWSPDGRQIALLYSEGKEQASGLEEWAAHKPLSGIIGEAHQQAQRIAVVNVTSSVLTSISPESLHVFEFDWSPDSRSLVYTAAPVPGENNWWVAKMYTQQAVCETRGASDCPVAPRLLVDPSRAGSPVHEQQLAVPRWSPDGRQIGFISGLMSDRGLTGGDLYVVPADGGSPQNLTPERGATPAFLAWLDANTLELAENTGGSSHLFAYDLKRRRELKDRSVTLPATVLPVAPRMSFSMSRDGELGLILSSYTAAPEVWAGKLPALRQVTHYNDRLTPLWGKAESVTWQNEGFDVQGWLLEPASLEPGRTYPMIVYVHGGPSYINTPVWPHADYGGVPFSALGYFVFLPNPRGSFGQGEKFTRANHRDFGYGDLRDILAGVDSVTRTFPIDSHHIGLTGWSYGGFMTMFAVTQTDRFYAAVAGAGVSDWQSYYGESFIHQWMPPFFGASVYDDPDVYARSSPITFIRNAHTPTLLLVGNADQEAPVQQLMEFWSGLRNKDVATQLVVYPDEGHHFTQHDHRLDVLARTLSWFQKYMPER
jgi:dipeptidyl aminopeptidase/acylaminoacyl peptidase